MATKYFRALISATSKKEARSILDVLVREKLVAGGLISPGESQYWWQGKLVRKSYWPLYVFTLPKHRKKVIATVEGLRLKEIPIIAFFKVEAANGEFLDWVSDSLH